MVFLDRRPPGTIQERNLSVENDKRRGVVFARPLLRRKNP